MGGCPKNAVYFAFVEFKIHQVLALVTDPTFDSAELLLFGSAQMTEPFSAEHKTFFSLVCNTCTYLNLKLWHLKTMIKNTSSHSIDPQYFYWLLQGVMSLNCFAMVHLS